MKRKISPYVVIDGKFDYLKILTGLYTSLENYPHRFNHVNIEHLPGKDGSVLEGTLIDGITKMPLVGTKEPASIGEAVNYRVISFNFNWAKCVIERFKDFCDSEGCLVYDSSAKKSDTEPPQERFAAELDNLKLTAACFKTLKNIKTSLYKDGAKETEH
ncbi:MAG: hypothetical protein V3U72_04295 [Candidatus Aenigmarchaeota archaeon]